MHTYTPGEMAAWGVVVGVIVGVVVGGLLALISASRRGRTEGEELRDRAARAEAELERQERSSADQRRLQDLVLSSMEEGVLLLDDHGRRVFSNPALERHLGTLPGSIEELRPLPFREIVRRTAETGQIERAEAETSAPSKWLRASAISVGPDRSVLLVVRDVTEARRLGLKRDVKFRRTLAEKFYVFEVRSDEFPRNRRNRSRRQTLNKWHRAQEILQFFGRSRHRGRRSRNREPRGSRRAVLGLEGGRRQLRHRDGVPISAPSGRPDALRRARRLPAGGSA